MLITRVYSTPDGESHCEDLDIPLLPSTYGSLSTLIPLKGVRFRQTPVGGALDFHNAPARQFIITLEGIVEVETTDGSKRRFGPGGIMLAEDITGRGHITREIEGPRRSIFLPVTDDFDASAWR